MSYTKRNYEQVEPRAPQMYFLREQLDCEELGLTVVDVDGGRNGKTHDHADDGQEEVYFLVEGSAQLTVEGDDLDLGPGDAVRVGADATRTLTFDDDGLMVIAGAP